MRNTSSRFAAVVAMLAFPAMGVCGLIDLSSSTALNADVSASLTRTSDKVADAHSSHDAGSLSKLSTSANASATLPIDATTSAVTTGSASSLLSRTGDAFHLTGSAASHLPTNCPFDALTESVSTATIPFTVASGGKAMLDYALNINAAVVNDEKVTVVVSRAGDSNALFSHVFKDSTSGSVSLSEPGAYQLVMIAGAHSTTKGIAGESGSAGFDVSFAAAPASPSTAIALPAAVFPGAVALASLAVVGARRARRLV